MGWANRITLARAVLTLALWALLVATAPGPATWAWWTAFGLFVVTAVTDAVDGALARRLSQVSVFGRIADPLVDKLLVLGTMVVLLGLDGVAAVLPAWAVVLVLARELLVTGLRSQLEARGISFAAVPLGKLKMLLQCVAIGAVMLHGAGIAWLRAPVLPGGGDVWNLTHLAVLAATLVTLVSGIAYGRRAIAMFPRE